MSRVLPSDRVAWRWSLVRYFMYLNADPSPPISALHSPDIIYMVSVPSSFLFFTTFPLSCIILNANWRTKAGEAWEQAIFPLFWCAVALFAFQNRGAWEWGYRKVDQQLLFPDHDQSHSQAISNRCSQTNTSLIPRPLATVVPRPPPVSFPDHH